MLIEQTMATENLSEIRSEIKQYYSNTNVCFDKTYTAYDGKSEHVDPTTTKKVFDSIITHIHFTSDDVLIDCGSGLGHVLYLSSCIFNRVIGIEILPDVANESIKNLIALIGEVEYKKKIEVIIGNVFEQPDCFFDQGTIFYIASPFPREDELSKLVDIIADSLQRKDRNAYIIYYYPHFNEIFKRYSNVFKLDAELHLIGDVEIYKHEKQTC